MFLETCRIAKVLCARSRNSFDMAFKDKRKMQTRLLIKQTETMTQSYQRPVM